MYNWSVDTKQLKKDKKQYKKMMECNLLEQEKFNRATMSWLAYAKFGNSWRLREKLGIIDDTPCF